MGIEETSLQNRLTDVMGKVKEIETSTSKSTSAIQATLDLQKASLFRMETKQLGEMNTCKIFGDLMLGL